MSTYPDVSLFCLFNPQPNRKENCPIQYKVIWEIDLDAESCEDAARKALETHRDPASIATCFTVSDETGICRNINLDSNKQ